MEGVSGIIVLVIFAFAVVLTLLSIFLPFFVYRIYQESIKTNNLLTKLINISHPENLNPPSEDRIKALQAEFATKRR